MNRRYLNRNELAAETAPAIRAALRTFSAENLQAYIPGHGTSVLAPVLAKRFGVSADRIMLTYGLEDFLRILFTSLDRRRDVVLTNELHYVFYDQVARAKSVRLATFRLSRGAETFSFDFDDCRRSVRRLKPAVLLLTSPNNPTGHVLQPEELADVLRTTPRTTLVILDEAYIGFQRGYDERAFLRMIKRFPNLALMRTFSKDYGLAGLRLGYVICGKNVRTMLRDENRDLGLSRIHEALGLAALKSEAHRMRAVERVCRDRDWFIGRVNELPSFRAFLSETNFVLIEPKTLKLRREFLSRSRRLQVVVTAPYGTIYVRVSVGRRGDLLALFRLMAQLDA